MTVLLKIKSIYTFQWQINYSHSLIDIDDN